MTTDSKARELSHKRRLGVAEPIRASQLQARPVDWLWTGRVPQGGLTVLAGEPGLGKSLLSIWLASGLSRGELGSEAAASLFLTAEDSREHTVLPRLVAARAKCERIVFPPPEKDGLERSISLPDDIGYLRQLIVKAAVRLVVFDPLVAYLPAKVNSWQDQSLRGALAPLAALAQQQAVAVLLVAHLNKGQNADPLRRLGGSIGAAELLDLNETEARSKLSEAEALLQAELEHGPRPVTELRDAAVELGISITTLDRAKKKLGVRSVKLDLDRWAWELTESEPPADEVAAA